MHIYFAYFLLLGVGEVAAVRHLKPTQQNPKGGLLRKEMPIHISNVSPVVDGRGTRVRFEKREDGSKVRLAVRGGKELSVLRGPKQG